MKSSEVIKRYAVFFVGLLGNAFGVAFVTKSALGASPIAAIPYSLSLVLPNLTMGNYVIIFNLLLVIMQWVILKDKANKVELLLQAVMTFCFGYFTDFALLVLANLNPVSYIIKIVLLVSGCLFLGLGVFFELIGNVVMLPGNALPRAIANTIGKEYGTVRVISDITMTIISGLISLIFLRQLISVREGTIIAALLVGNIITMWKKVLASLEVVLNDWITK